MNIKQFVFNPFGVNCYIISNDACDAILIDPSVSNAREQSVLADYIKNEHLNVRHLLNTHLHLDHVLGNAFIERTYGIKAEAHKADTNCSKNKHKCSVSLATTLHLLSVNSLTKATPSKFQKSNCK